MGINLLLDAIRKGEFDPACTRYETALRAIWLLYRWRRWDLLSECGIDRESFEPLFDAFDSQLETNKIKTDKQTLAFLRFIKEQGKAITLLSAAVWMVGQYMGSRRQLMAAYYNNN